MPDKIHSAKPPALGKVPVSGSEKKESTMIQPEGTRSLLNMLLSTSSSSPMHANNGNACVGGASSLRTMDGNYVMGNGRTREETNLIKELDGWR